MEDMTIIIMAQRITSVMHANRSLYRKMGKSMLLATINPFWHPTAFPRKFMNPK